MISGEIARKMVGKNLGNNIILYSLLSSINQSIDQNLLFTYQDTKLSHVTMSINPFFSFFFFPFVFASSIIFLVKIKFKTNKKFNLKKTL